MRRILKPTGKALVLEFSKPVSARLSQIYDVYSFSVLPAMGHFVAQTKNHINTWPNQFENTPIKIRSQK